MLRSPGVTFRHRRRLLLLLPLLFHPPLLLDIPLHHYHIHNKNPFNFKNFKVTEFIKLIYDWDDHLTFNDFKIAFIFGVQNLDIHHYSRHFLHSIDLADIIKTFIQKCPF